VIGFPLHQGRDTKAVIRTKALKYTSRRPISAVCLLALLGSFGLPALATPAMAQEGENLLANGDFESNIDRWTALDIEKGDDGKPRNVAANEGVLQRVTADDGDDGELTADGSSGALKVTFDGFAKPDIHPVADGVFLIDNITVTVADSEESQRAQPGSK